MHFKEYKSSKKAFARTEPFTPSKINNIWEWDDRYINLLLSKASYYLGQLDAMTKYLPNAKLVYSMGVINEAMKSNEIEGTNTELIDIIDDSDESNEKWQQIKQISNYINAAHLALDKITQHKFDEKFILETHYDVLGGKESKSGNPGKYKVSQNWIGGATKYDARFTPCSPKDVPSLMKDLIEFINNDKNEIPDLVKIGIIHYQFETIHPFEDGNGRIGRLMIPLYLINKGILEYPLFVSHFFAKERRNYYDNLNVVRWDSDLNQWIRFFLVAIKTSAQRTIKVIERVMSLKTDMEALVVEKFKGNSAHALELLNISFKTPLLTASKVGDLLGVSSATANSLLRKFEDLDILAETTGQKRNRKYQFQQYFKVLLENEEEVQD